jgi:glycosyltransferase involved in cell wall biosynthesis
MLYSNNLALHEPASIPTHAVSANPPDRLIAPDLNNNAMKIALIGGYRPRRCGIATFTTDSFLSLKHAFPSADVNVYALTHDTQSCAPSPPVCRTIIDNDVASFRDAAVEINNSGADIVWLQHEFGIFGGAAGEFVFELLDRIAAPVIITLHTVLPEPDAHQMGVMRRLLSRASKLIVMSVASKALLKDVYGAADDQVEYIPHGVPDRPFGRNSRKKQQLGLVGRNVLMTFGLISPGKGIETVIEAMPQIVQSHPDTSYYIVGATHPNLVASEGERYRDSLKALARSLGVDAHIQWVDEFLDDDVLLDYIEAADIYITPYPGAAQATSGTLSFAFALGKAIISTPYRHATELLAEDHGILVPFNDSTAIAEEISSLLDDPKTLHALQLRAYNRGRTMLWPVSARKFMAAAKSVKVDKPVVSFAAHKALPADLPLQGFLRIVDDTGILQHSVFAIPDRTHGYCIDDNARALILMNALKGSPLCNTDQLASTFAAFVQHAWNPETNRFRNFMDYGRNWLEDSGSDDSNGRAIWALGHTVRCGVNDALSRWALDLFDRASHCAFAAQSPRAMAFAMLGADDVLSVKPDHSIAHKIMVQGSAWLALLLAKARSERWCWFETVLAYDNCRLSEALIRAGVQLDRPAHIAAGLETLTWISDKQITPDGFFRPVGSNSFGRIAENPLPFDQQPVEAWAAIDAAEIAYNATGDAKWLDVADKAYGWFLGANDRAITLGSLASGTCRDGINPRGVNENQGAESVLAFQLAHVAMQRLVNRTESVTFGKPAIVYAGD